MNSTPRSDLRHGPEVRLADMDPSVATRERGGWTLTVTPRQGGPLPLRSRAVSIGRGRLVAAVQDMVVCLEDGDSGCSVFWTYETGDYIPGSPAVAEDGSIRVHSNDRLLHGISSSGAPLWPPVGVGSPLGWATPLIDGEGNSWVCGYAGGLLKVDSTGKTLPRLFFRSSVKFDCTGVLADQSLIVGGEDQFVHCIDLSGTRGKDRWNLAAHPSRTGWYINSAIAVAEGPIYVVASRDGILYGFDSQGVEVWKTSLPGQAIGSPVVDGEQKIYIGISKTDRDLDSRGCLACFDSMRRIWLWELNTIGSVESTPVLGNDGVAYFGDNAGWIYAVTSEGTPVWSQCIGSAIRSALSVSSGRVIFGTDAGQLVGLSCESTDLAAGWPQLLGPNVDLPEAATPGPAAPQTRRISNRVRIESFASPAVISSASQLPRPPEQLAPLIVEAETGPPGQTVVEAGFQAVGPSTDSIQSLGIVESPMDRLAALSGRLSAIVDFRSGKDLWNTIHPFPWKLSRQAQTEEIALVLKNDGPGVLTMKIGTFGKGLSASPKGWMRVPPGRFRFVVLRIDPACDPWMVVEFRTPASCIGRRQRLRIQRTIAAE